jgi:hypothetical protein
MTARRLRRKNKSDVKRFLYVPLPIATVSFVGSEKTRVAVELSHLWGPKKLALPWSAVIGRVLPQIIATSQRIAFCRKAP